jgi:hypothetical protein
MLTLTLASVSTSIHSLLVNCDPGSVLKHFGAPCFTDAFFNASTQNAACKPLESHQANTLQLTSHDRHKTNEPSPHQDVSVTLAPDLVRAVNHNIPEQELPRSCAAGASCAC